MVEFKASHFEFAGLVAVDVELAVRDSVLLSFLFGRMELVRLRAGLVAVELVVRDSVLLSFLFQFVRSRLQKSLHP